MENVLLTLPPPVVVIGNGRITDAGYAINKYSSVIRINNFITRGHEKDVGNSTTVWCVNCWHDVLYRNLGITMITPFHPNDAPRVLSWHRDLCIPQIHWSDKIRGLKPRKPSTGLILLYAMKELGVEYDTYGFDGFQTGHYWDPGHEHDHPEEMEAFSNGGLV